MTRINRPDTLLTELRDLKRRLRLLEAGRMRPPGMLAALTGEPLPSAGGPVMAGSASFIPARPVDWPGTASEDWERLLVARTVPGHRGTFVELHLAADGGTRGAVRIVVDGEPVNAPALVTDEESTKMVLVGPSSAISEIAVEARRIGGSGLVRASALLLPA